MPGPAAMRHTPICLLLMLAASAADAAEPWRMHTIDNSQRGADGVKLADIDGDGRLDVATAWEEGGAIRVYRNRGKRAWLREEVGRVRSPEDAVFADLDGDRAWEVISACEGDERALFVHWARPRWRTEAIPASRGVMQWMFTLPMQIDGRHGIDLVAGGKGPGAAIGWMEAPARPRDLAGWKWHPLRDAGWIMSSLAADMDGDGDQDILFSDRRGPRSGVYWLENGAAWQEHTVGAVGREVMFIDLADFDGDGQRDVIAAVKPHDVLVHLRRGGQWAVETVPFPADFTGTAKAVRVADIDRNGRPDLVYTAEKAAGELRGAVWMDGATRQVHDISGAPGVKYDLIELHDFDGDGDLDLLTTEEVDGLGVIWYENPLYGQQ